MSWTLFVIVMVGVFFVVARCAQYLGIISRVRVTYTQRERIGWACAFALLSFTGGDSLHSMLGLVMGIAIYLRGPQYYRYRFGRISQAIS